MAENEGKGTTMKRHGHLHVDVISGWEIEVLAQGGGSLSFSGHGGDLISWFQSVSPYDKASGKDVEELCQKCEKANR